MRCMNGFMRQKKILQEIEIGDGFALLICFALFL